MQHEQRTIEFTNRHFCLSVDEKLLSNAVGAVCDAEGISSVELSLVLTDNAEIHRINREFLGHDYPTDVISFPLDDELADPAGEIHPVQLQGELVISLDTAQDVAATQGWSLEAEVVLYVIHGLLHLCGYDDHSEETRLIMRKREREILSGLCLPRGEDPSVSGWDLGTS